MFVTYSLENTSTRKDVCNHITIKILNALGEEVVGEARMVSFNDIWLELPEVQGRYELRVPYIRRLKKMFISDMDDLVRFKWKTGDGEYILKNMKKVRKAK